MTPSNNHHCLEDMDFYSYVVGSPGAKPGADVEAHLSSCSGCRQELAALLRTLHPEPGEPSEFVQARPEEIQDTLAFIQKASRLASGGYKWRQWGAVAAAAVIGVALLSAGSLYFYIRIRSQAFYSQAQSLLQGAYEPRSPSDLRLDLPFKSEASQRAASNEEAFAGAEKLFNQALGAREGMSEALLGLGYLHLQKNEFSKAEQQFNAALNARSSGGQALLGRGVSRFEEGLSTADPVARGNYLAGALADFESVLKANPGSNEARYNKIRVLYVTGQHRQALQEIDAYLARDPDSIWAVKLRDLKISIQMNRSELLEKEVDRAAQERDVQALETLVRIVPDKVPTTVTTLLRRALAAEGYPALAGSPDSDALRWAAETLASAYGNSTKDESCSRLLDFYAGLSPPQKQAKKVLDARLEQLISLFKKNELKAALQRSESLIQDFKNLKDYWQLVRVYQLRGNSFYYRADLHAAVVEYIQMVKYAELTSNPDLIAKSLLAQASPYSTLREYDKALKCISRAKALAESFHLESWMALASHTIGFNYLKLNRFEDSLREYSLALSIACRIGDPIVMSCLENLGEVMERMHRYPEASEFYRLAADRQSTFLREGIVESAPEAEAVRVSLLYREGYLALRTENMAAAENYFGEAIRGSLDGMKQLECLSRLGLAQVYLEEKKYKEAQAQTDLVLDMTSQNNYPEVEWQVYSLKGSLLKQAGDEARAIDYFIKAASALESQRANVTSLDLRQSFFAQRFDPYRQIVSLLYHSQNNPRQALKYAERAKAMTLSEYLSLHHDPADWGSLHPFGMPDLDPLGSLPAGIMTLEYFLSNDEFFVFVSGSNGTEAVSVQLPLPELESLVQKYLESIKNNDASSFTNLSRKLHQLLIDPILKRVESQRPEALLILPDGPLHLLPFGSLMDLNGRYLLEKFALSYAPSRKALQYCLSQRKTGRITPASSIVFIDGASNLPGADRELAFLARLYPGANKILDTPNLQQIGSIVQNYEIIHFSGHAKLYQGTPRLIFHTSQGDTYLDSSIIQKWRLRKTCLVTLAGCNTGIGPIFEGETPWGLVPSFLSAGAPSILVSLLPVDDAATGNLTSKFYDLLTHSTSSKAQALRLAQLDLLKAFGAEARRRPLSWVPFVLVGDPL